MSVKINCLLRYPSISLFNRSWLNGQVDVPLNNIYSIGETALSIYTTLSPVEGFRTHADLCIPRTQASSWVRDNLANVLYVRERCIYCRFLSV